MSEIQEYPTPQDMEAQADATLAPRIGLLLRKAREARGLSVNDVVHSLKFSPRQIEALEADDMAALPGSVFVRGIIRSYARFLKLDPEPLLALLEAKAPVAPPDVRAPDNMGNAMPKSGIHQIPPLVALSVLLLIAAATMIAWHFFLGIRATPELVPATQGTATTTTEAVESPPLPVPPPRVVVEQPIAKVAPVPAARPALPDDAKELIFDFRGTSWVEVLDASQQIVLTGQFGAGTRQSISGRPPFQMVIGNATNVDLRFEGRAVDLKPHTRAEVARLTLE
ncbi:MAG TPA: RodZ domain-containing protein [Rhodocyclaceae bacterium]|nr:RodZ domain-containing protein [Rhodocyclaceae bacterium]